MDGADRSLRILHVLRSPVGGLFRHVIDMVHGQVARGHQVGIICDADTGGNFAARILHEVTPQLALGLSRTSMPRQIGVMDVSATRYVARRVAETLPDIVHGHGAKGAAYARLAVSPGGPLRVYTPHGGSLLYRPRTPIAAIYMLMERLLKRRTDLLLFESTYIARLYTEKVGAPQTIARVVPNGVAESEFAEVPLRANATDLLYIGELRRLKGVDLLIGSVPVLDLFDRPIADWDVVMKWLFDKIIGGLLLIAALPLMALIALAIKFDSRGPVLFRQKRYGFNNDLIEVYKFRSMYVDQADANANKLVTKDDPRVTRVGRFIRKASLDELPQLFNVV